MTSAAPAVERTYDAIVKNAGTLLIQGNPEAAIAEFEEALHHQASSKGDVVTLQKIAGRIQHFMSGDQSLMDPITNLDPKEVHLYASILRETGLHRLDTGLHTALYNPHWQAPSGEPLETAIEFLVESLCRFENLRNSGDGPPIEPTELEELASLIYSLKRRQEYAAIL